MRVEVAALSTDVRLLVGVQEGRPLHTWFRGPSERSGSMPRWFTTTRLCEQSSGPMPLPNFRAWDVSSREATLLLGVGIIPSSSSGSIDFWFTSTRFSARSLLGMHHALCQYLLLISVAHCNFSEESHCSLSRPGERQKGLNSACQHCAVELIKGECRSLVISA